MIDFVAAPAKLPAGRRVYAVGDVHGCLDRLTALHAAIAQDLADRPIEDALLIHLGDYVDRGPDSAGVVGLLAAGPAVRGTRAVNLMGNHEAMMLDALSAEDTETIELWLANSGAGTLQSWGVPAATKPGAWAQCIPSAHLRFLRDLTLRHAEGPYLFVHAGIRPGVPLAKQARHDLLWMREPFLSSRCDLGAVVVHGHTPRPAPEIRTNRIGIDTGAVMGGALTCAVLELDRLGFLTN